MWEKNARQAAVAYRETQPNAEMDGSVVMGSSALRTINVFRATRAASAATVNCIAEKDTCAQTSSRVSPSGPASTAAARRIAGRARFVRTICSVSRLPQSAHVPINVHTVPMDISAQESALVFPDHPRGIAVREDTALPAKCAHHLVDASPKEALIAATEPTASRAHSARKSVDASRYHHRAYARTDTTARKATRVQVITSVWHLKEYAQTDSIAHKASDARLGTVVYLSSLPSHRRPLRLRATGSSEG